MLNNLKNRDVRRQRRSMRIRKSVRGTAEQPRLTVNKSNKHIFAQLIDDEKGLTLASASTMQKEFAKSASGKTKEAARHIGKKIGELAQKLNIKRAVFDRGHMKYHGVLAELANAAREAGIKF